MLPDWWPSDKPWIIADCLEVMKGMPDKCVDLVLTDPPYGVNVDYGNTYIDTEENWYNLIDKFIVEARRISKMVIFPSCQIKRLKWFYINHPPDWLICWYKGSVGHSAFIGFNDWEPHLVYGKNNTRMHDYFYCTPQSFDNGHPCPKPPEWAIWLIERATNIGDIVFDPFLGSGTTLLACRKTDRIGLGCEINPEYEAIIEKRSMQNITKLDMFGGDEP